ncbi:ADP-ribose pyrophosphatase [Flexivirga endophytica]|uniref:ADP-ribose pyrophosphatase n=1 Tax=Flexivirga endophytica TaxID=1849103 RepID=A0A916SW65_9MICO|nr:ADP-ribose pyrophosphatase [Flexivirga endophytica]GHB36907.1 ADP-ribose pyrophosphatase [Flexivirga endophytica]
MAWVAADIVALTLRDGVLSVALVKRKPRAARGRWALPGGFLLPGESAEQAAYRELAEEGGLGERDVRLEQLGTYSDPRRDVEHEKRVISIAYLALAANLPEPVAGTDAADASWVPVDQAVGKALAFDHTRILEDGIERARSKLEYSTLATSFLDETFTISELRSVYEAVWGVRLDAANFHRKVTSTDGFVEATGEERRGRGRPAKLFRAGSATSLNPPITR